MNAVFLLWACASSDLVIGTTLEPYPSRVAHVQESLAEVRRLEQYLKTLVRGTPVFQQAAAEYETRRSELNDYLMRNPIWVILDESGEVLSIPEGQQDAEHDTESDGRELKLTAAILSHKVFGSRFKRWLLAEHRKFATKTDSSGEPANGQSGGSRAGRAKGAAAAAQSSQVKSADANKRKWTNKMIIVLGSSFMLFSIGHLFTTGFDFGFFGSFVPGLVLAIVGIYSEFKAN